MWSFHTRWRAELTIRSVRRFHTRHVLSLPPPTTIPPPISQQVIEWPVVPRNVARRLPLAVSHTFTKESLPQVATRSTPVPSYLILLRSYQFHRHPRVYRAGRLTSHNSLHPGELQQCAWERLEPLPRLRQIFAFLFLKAHHPSLLPLSFLVRTNSSSCLPAA